MKYTNEMIRLAFEGYWKKTDKVLDYLKLLPLNSQGIDTIVNVSKDFQIVTEIKQSYVGKMLTGEISDKISICRELILSQKKNKNMPSDKSFLEQFVGIPLNIELKPFIFIAYDQETENYVMNKAKIEGKLDHCNLMKTQKEVLFYLIRDEKLTEELGKRLFHFGSDDLKN